MVRIVHVIEDDPTYAAYLATVAGRLPEVHVERWSGALAFLDGWDRREHGVVVLDNLLPDLNGAEFVTRHVPDPVDLPILMVTGAPSVRLALDVAHRGVVDVVAKPISADTFAAALADLLRREAEGRAARVATRAYRDGLRALTDREREVLALLMEGHTNKETAWELGISPRTVEIHRANILTKVGRRSIVELAHVSGQLEGKAAGPSGVVPARGGPAADRG